MLRIAVIGVGWAGRRHVEAISELAGALPPDSDLAVSVEMLVDSDLDHLAAQAADLGIEKTATDFRAALDDPAIDAVSIATPHAHHVDAAVAASEAGKHVMCEKPMALTVRDASRMIDAADAAGVRLYVAENVPYGPMARFLRELVDSRRYIGELTSATVAAGFRAQPRYQYAGRRAWLARPELGGTGTWMLHGIHTVAGLRYVLGEVDAVYAREHHTPSFPTPEVEGTMTALLTMASGLSVTLTQTCETRFPPDHPRYVLYGERATVRATRHEAEVFSTDFDQSAPHRIPYPQDPLSDYALEFQAFAAFVARGVEGPTTGHSERRSLALVQAGYESAASGRPIVLRERFGDI